MTDESDIKKVYIDANCEMCRRFGLQLGARGLAVQAREAVKNGSIEVHLEDGKVLKGYSALLEIKRRTMPRFLFKLLKSPVIAIPGEIAYKVIARNRKFISKIIR